MSNNDDGIEHCDAFCSHIAVHSCTRKACRVPRACVLALEVLLHHLCRESRVPSLAARAAVDVCRQQAESDQTERPEAEDQCIALRTGGVLSEPRLHPAALRQQAVGHEVHRLLLRPVSLLRVEVRVAVLLRDRGPVQSQHA